MRIRAWCVCAPALLAALVWAGPAGAAQGGQKLDERLQSLNSGSTERVIIRSKPGRRAELKQLLKACGPKLKGEHRSIDALTVEVSTECIEKLSASDVVDSIGSDVDVESSASSTQLTSIPSN